MLYWEIYERRARSQKVGLEPNFREISIMEAPGKPLTPPQSAPLIDPFGRAISYVRVSVTDRCDFRCVYCMSEHMAFLPRRDLLTLEELDRLIAAFVSRGTKKLRITGGEPLVRHDVMRLFKALSRHLDTGGLEELTLTTNGSQLSRFADHLFDCGVRRVNVSLDTLNPELFRQITRTGSHEQVMAGLDAARMAGLKVKINVVALKGVNENEFISLVQFAHDRGFDITFIEVMPLGELDGPERIDQYLPMQLVREKLSTKFTLQDSNHRTAGPARYVRATETGGRIGFITPLTHNFCESCNRVRVTCTGRLYMCLGQEDAADLRAPLRSSGDDHALHAALTEAIGRKPKGHDFVIDRTVQAPAVARHMSMTGG
jgi:cyclic pyranopterin phosphate synthase